MRGKSTGRDCGRSRFCEHLDLSSNVKIYLITASYSQQRTPFSEMNCCRIVEVQHFLKAASTMKMMKQLEAASYLSSYLSLLKAALPIPFAPTEHRPRSSTSTKELLRPRSTSTNEQLRPRSTNTTTGATAMIHHSTCPWRAVSLKPSIHGSTRLPGSLASSHGVQSASSTINRATCWKW